MPAVALRIRAEDAFKSYLKGSVKAFLRGLLQGSLSGLPSGFGVWVVGLAM